MVNKNYAWITWERQRRNRSLSKALDADLYELIESGPRWRKHPVLLIRTLRVLVQNRHKVICVQNPSLLLALLAVLLAPLLQYTIVVDEHNWGLFPLGGGNRLLNKIARFVARHASLIIVSNENLAALTRTWGANVAVLPDPLPAFSFPIQPISRQAITEIFFVCTWADDEPYESVFTAAECLSADVKIFMTGRPPEAIRQRQLSDKIVLTGYLSEDDYAARLASADFVMVLTTMDDCLNCGAYEAVSMNKPMILSDTSCIRDYFSRGAIYTAPDPKSIADAIERAIRLKDELGQSVAVLQRELIESWGHSFKALREVIEQEYVK